MIRWLALITLAGCGRIGFELASPSDAGADTLASHDEDGDGVPDFIDVCPCTADDQANTDGDGVGDVCDPRVGVGGDQLRLFASMQPGDQPTNEVAGQGTWTQQADALVVSGDLTGDFYAGRTLPLVAGTVRVELAVKIVAIGNPAKQHQLAITTTTALPHYLGELNEQIGSYSHAQISKFDGLLYTQTNAQSLVSGIHPGLVDLTFDETVNTRTQLTVTWPGESYAPGVSDTVYQGSNQLQIDVNNLDLEIQSMCVITSP